ncbi:MAG: DUF3380 domain-containing protein [Pseudomonadales bacterium]|nr:DUF3380 domain-containing protein [Pseudomonadales bacterium]
METEVREEPWLMCWVTAGQLKVRNAPARDAPELGILHHGDAVRIVAKSGQWYGIEFADQEGFIAARYVALADPNPGRLIPVSGNGSLRPSRQFPETGDATTRKVAGTWNRYGKLLARLSDEYRMDVACVVAVLCVESSGQGFSASNDGRMIIRFENHKFWQFWGAENIAHFQRHYRFNSEKRWTGHQWRDNANGVWRRFHGDQRAEWEVLIHGMTLDREAALKSVSMGAPQIMGFNHRAAGFASAAEMFSAFCEGTDRQIEAMFRFMSAKMLNCLRDDDFSGFAALYNGSGQKTKYGQWIRRHCDRFREIQTAQQ